MPLGTCCLAKLIGNRSEHVVLADKLANRNRFREARRVTTAVGGLPPACSRQSMVLNQEVTEINHSNGPQPTNMLKTARLFVTTVACIVS